MATCPTDRVRLQFQSSTVSLPIHWGTEGEAAVDIGQLRGLTGLTTFDPGLGNTASCRSAVTFVDGTEGILRYRGYDVDQIAEHGTFPEVAWLLLHGRRPDEGELAAFLRLVESQDPPRASRALIRAYPQGCSPTTILAGAVAGLSAFSNPSYEVDDTAAGLLASTATLTAWIHRHARRRSLTSPKARTGFAADLLRRMSGAEPSAAAARTLDRLLILHADHEQNCSTSTVRMVGSSGADLYTSVAAGIGALSGPRHGGANVQVVEMLDQICAAKVSPEDYVARAKDGKARLMGFGHRIYKAYDPRAALLRRECPETLARLGASGDLFEVALRLEKIAMSDDYFISRNLYPNVDFYSGILFTALGIPKEMFTTMFALGRLPGWIAHWYELRADPEHRIARPRQLYVGPTARPWAASTSNRVTLESSAVRS